MEMNGERRKNIEDRIGDGTPFGDGKMYRRWYSLFPNEAKAAERICNDLESKLERLTPLDYKSEIYPWAEHAYAEKEEIEAQARSLFETFERYLPAVDRELERYRQNSLHIRRGYGSLQTEEAREYYMEGELKQDAVYHEGRELRDGMVEIMKKLERVLRKAMGRKFPGGKQPRRMEDQIEHYPPPIPPGPRRTPLPPQDSRDVGSPSKIAPLPPISSGALPDRLLPLPPSVKGALS